MRRSVIVDTVARIVFHSALVLSLYLLAVGHNQPGGGFVGGLVASAAFALVYVAGGSDDVRKLSRLNPWLLLGTGLLIASSAAIAPLVLGDSLLESGYIVSFDAPVLGHVGIGSTLVFDLGVYAVVTGVVLAVIESFGPDVEVGAEEVA
jgi:multicomponent Na+:H+ antiporter subunit A